MILIEIYPKYRVSLIQYPINRLTCCWRPPNTSFDTLKFSQHKNFNNATVSSKCNESSNNLFKNLQDKIIYIHVTDSNLIADYLGGASWYKRSTRPVLNWGGLSKCSCHGFGANGLWKKYEYINELALPKLSPRCSARSLQKWKPSHEDWSHGLDWTTQTIQLTYSIGRFAQLRYIASTDQQWKCRI